MPKVANLRAKAGSYMKDGEEKTRYITVGSVIESPKGRFYKLDSIPAVEFDGWLYESNLEDAPRREVPAAPAKPAAQMPANFDEDIPF